MSDDTLKTYDFSAKELSKYFQGIGARTNHIEQALELAGKNDGSASVLELGCGDGRDAEEIIKRTQSYTGIDYSKELIKLAKQKLPSADFRIVDMQNFDFPFESYDVVFAFASLLHIDKENLKLLMKKVARSLKVGGIFYISTKYADKYKEEWKEDKFGKRLFYFYNAELITKLASEFDVVTTDTVMHNTTAWLEMVLRKA
jgi:SAM-dependent methyltransferase